jgi:hypothetical protein
MVSPHEVYDLYSSYNCSKSLHSLNSGWCQGFLREIYIYGSAFLARGRFDSQRRFCYHAFSTYVKDGLVRPIFGLRLPSLVNVGGVLGVHCNAEYEQPQLEQGLLYTDKGLNSLVTAASRPTGHLSGSSLASKQMMQHV